MRSFYCDPRSGQMLDAPDVSGVRPCLCAMLPEPDFRVPGQRARRAVIVLGGGGFDHMSVREGEPVALQFAAAGMVAFTLYYAQIPRRYPEQMLDAAWAVAYVRAHAAQMCIDPDAIFLCGLSAGAHPAAGLTIYSTAAQALKSCSLPVGCAPNGLILGYPLLDTGPYGHPEATRNLLGEGADDPHMLDETALIRHVHAQMPSVFLWHTQQDESIPALGTLAFASALVRLGVPCEMHLYPHGCHGLSLARSFTATSPRMIRPECAMWMDAALRWMTGEAK